MRAVFLLEHDLECAEASRESFKDEMGSLLFKLLPKKEQKILRVCITIANIIFLLGTRKGGRGE